MRDKRSLSHETEKQSSSPADVPSPPSFTRGDSYEIKVAGHLDEHWSTWIGDLNLSHDASGNTVLKGSVPDQAALHGILVHIRDLGLPLISLIRLEKH